ncbi:FAD-binding protein [Rhodococcus sp. NCIMB 12038]|uniref:FAD-binding protein n=1 Tax=Rhodococcus sp. NCIMB 12038 TaxID=933800 RepID=UPI000B3CD61C|nr:MULTISPECIES: FAD-binding protein [unclassified Rhodococcus (in: high G+C Gram-positive bacteria)]OUS86552.1 electron transfer flavoprotein [Rhodococcus sp. NCIMB 12038]OZE92835.1 electron transfer flavoprotein [Rhodococcus sp. 15-1189-1-1a]OZF08091.1 electron transfer flavoprotein [Rhodococcus sp. 14-2686-1-2]
MSTPPSGRVLVCVKQIPAPSTVAFDERTKRIHRDSDAAITNPADLCALTHALSLRDALGWEVVVVTMGPPAAQATLLDALHRGADHAIHLLDRRFAGADTLATARAIARLVERESPDLVLTGRWTLDGATAQVGPQVAELVGLPQLTQVLSLHPGDDGRIRAEVETDIGTEDWSIELPALVSVGRGMEPPWVVDAVDAAAIETVTADDLGGGPRDFGTRGSPTFVVEIRPGHSMRSTEHDADAAASMMTAVLAAAREDLGAATYVAGPSSSQREIWAVAEPLPGGGLHPTSLEALACARSVAAELHSKTVAVLPGAHNSDALRVLHAHGADRVIVLSDAGLAEYATERFTRALSAAISAGSPFAVIAPFSARGRDYAPRVAARLGLGLTGDFVALEVRGADSDDPDLLWLKPALAGNVLAPVIAHTTPSMGTLRPGSFSVAAVRDEGHPQIDVLELADDVAHDRCMPIERRVENPEAPHLTAARVVIGLGPGLDAATRRAAERLAQTTDGAVAATPAAVAAGDAPQQIEIGPLARTISPSFYLGLGRHDPGTLRAVAGAGKIVVVDPDAQLDELSGLADAIVTADIESILGDLLTQVLGTHTF